MNNLELRIAALERANRRYRLCFGVLALGMAGLIAAGGK